ncbi:MAG: hypothetical protein A3I33_02635 [Candidatus Colwellbacteria bacterium RIFCSPLOWO2_02_FULL_45_11]|uniref:Aminotransferase class V domain-containing protein n=1 Tax=Candidatus Colwellbacteria bacterium RIFCSPLOWO2_02_FULL_45_11 TaxID=1797692 RepID=A0A1G1Z749_9BACT|nr:MAG: hypothetical protein A3I33_02635 [Candidatus Colwellbacteria bacterium RIFCSPLOWO2_02_FULL_45_11]
MTHALSELIHSDREAPQRLTAELEKMFGGKTHLFYKGRDAIEFALKSYGIESGDEVLIQGFTCYAIEQAVLRTGATPVFVDVGKNNLNVTLDSLKNAHKNTTKAKAVLVQYTLGSPIGISQIKEWCEENKLLLIEDLAQSLGATDEKGTSLGTYGDAVVLSFGRGKVVDAVSGGAVILRREGAREIKVTDTVRKAIIVKDMLYPLTAWKVRKTYKILLGPLILRISRKLGLVTSATGSPTKNVTLMPEEHASLALSELGKLKNTLRHRKKIAEIYYQEIQDKSSIITSQSDIEHGSNLRFALRVDKPAELLRLMDKKGIHIWDRWYRAAVDCGTLSVSSVYKNGTTPNAEELAIHIVNLPTHKEVRERDAMRISKVVNQYLDK